MYDLAQVRQVVIAGVFVDRLEGLALEACLLILTLEPLWFGVNVVSMLATTFLPIVLSPCYLRFLLMQVFTESVPALDYSQGNIGI
jgi:hypothetical protein